MEGLAWVELVDLSRIEFFNVDFRGASAMPSGYRSTHETKGLRATILFGMTPLNDGLASLVKAHFAQTLPLHIFRLARGEADARSIAARVHAQYQQDAGSG